MNEKRIVKTYEMGLIRDGERLDDLNANGWHILQRPDGFCFGMDSVLLADFASGRKGIRRAVDLGCGSGVLPLLIRARMPGVCFDAVEIQPDIADMAARTMRICGMDAYIHVHSMNLLDAPRALGYERYDLAVSNPPYGKTGASLPNEKAERRAARHEGEADIAAICHTSFSLLKNGGRFALIFPAQRFLELMNALCAARIEPKRVRLVHPKWGEAPNLCLVEGIKAAKPGLHFMPPLYIRDSDGNETDELRRIYGNATDA